jgi:hypothetical protein
LLNIIPVRTATQALHKLISVQTNLIGQTGQRILVETHPLILIKDMLVLKKLPLVLGTPGRLGSQAHFRITQVVGMGYISNFSGVNVRCFQQLKCVEDKVSTVRSAIVRIFYDGNGRVDITLGWELAHINIHRLITQNNQATNNQDCRDNNQNNHGW